MEAKELRAGNIVYKCNKYDLENQICICCNGTIAFPHLLEPVPLTEEWLLKFGFVSNNDEHENEYYHNKEELFGVKLEVFTEQNKNCHIWDNAFTGAPIEYVHQLQNLYFALTGEELIYK